MGGYCVIGKSLPHTLSPVIHGMLGNADYGVREFADVNELARFVNGGECEGYNVTIPYKQDIIPMLDELSQGARDIGAVNTVVNDGGRLVGYNTDIDGIRFAFEKADISISGKNVLILGSGGTSHTARYVCEKDGAKSVRIVSRTGEINYTNCYDLADMQVIINTTPVGMMPNACQTPIDVSRFSKLEGVFDCVYNPLETMLVKNARELGIKAANGLSMLVEQARIAHNLFQNAKGLAPVGEETTDKICKELMRARRNIVLIGMAGSGKSVIGKQLAKRLHREFADTDMEVEIAEGTSIPNIFAERGEPYFRAAERAAVERVCTKLGLVIATGGGAVLDERNAFFMGANGVRVWINRPPEKLATHGRPLSKDMDRARKLYEERKPIYRAAADIIIENDRDIRYAVNEIVQQLGE